MLLVRRKLPLDLLAIIRDTHNREKEKSSGQATLFNIWTILALYIEQNHSSTSDEPEFLCSNSLKFHCLCFTTQTGECYWSGKAPPYSLAITRDTLNRDREKTLGQANLFNIWKIWAMDRTSAQPGLFRSNSLKFRLCWWYTVSYRLSTFLLLCLCSHSGRQWRS